MKIAVIALCLLCTASCTTTGPDGQSQLSPATQAALERLGVTVINSLEAAATQRLNDALKVRPQK